MTKIWFKINLALLLEFESNYLLSGKLENKIILIICYALQKDIITRWYKRLRVKEWQHRVKNDYCYIYDFHLQHIFSPKISCPDCVAELGKISDLLGTDAFANKVREKQLYPVLVLVVTSIVSNLSGRLLKTWEDLFSAETQLTSPLIKLKLA